MQPSRSTLAVAICAALAAGGANGAQFDVTTTADSGTGSLREALQNAAGNAEADVIDLSAVSGQTIALTTGALVIDGDEITIEGSEVTIDAGGTSRVLEIVDSEVTLNDLTITGGDADYGGGILGNGSDLILNDSIVTANNAEATGGGVYLYSKYGSLTMTRSAISDNEAGYGGGGLAVATDYGAITISDSVITGNVVTGDIPEGATPEESRFEEFLAPASRWPDGDRGSMVEPRVGNVAGAGLAAGTSDIEITNSTISDNRANGSVGGFSASSFEGDVTVIGSTVSGNTATTGSYGGAVLESKYGSAILQNSTVSGNSADTSVGGVALITGVEDTMNPPRGNDQGAGQAVIVFSTITDNTSYVAGGAGLGTYEPASIGASVIAGNNAVTDSDIGFRGADSDVITADLFSSLVRVDPVSGTLNRDAASVSLAGNSPLLAPLTDNGGPTRTHLPYQGSPLIDAVAPFELGCGSEVGIDQRGVSRPEGAGCDVGSVEGVGPPPPEIVPVPVFDRLGLWLMAGLLGLAGLWTSARGALSRRAP